MKIFLLPVWLFVDIHSGKNERSPREEWIIIICEASTLYQALYWIICQRFLTATLWRRPLYLNCRDGEKNELQEVRKLNEVHKLASRQLVTNPNSVWVQGFCSFYCTTVFTFRYFIMLLWFFKTPVKEISFMISSHHLHCIHNTQSLPEPLEIVLSWAAK